MTGSCRYEQDLYLFSKASLAFNHIFRLFIILLTPSKNCRYALGELVESEKDYINDLSELLDKLDEENPEKFRNKVTLATELKELAEFHRNLFLPELMACSESPMDVAQAFMNWVCQRCLFVSLHSLSIMSLSPSN